MIALDLEALERVTGGNSEASISTPLASASVSQSDYARCVDTVQQQTAAQYPSTATFPWQTDANAGARATATMQAMRDVCGIPGRPAQ